jgi:Ras-related protein Rab-22
MSLLCGGNSGAVKTIMLGDSGVGKSSIAMRFVNDEFSPYLDSTIGADYYSKTIDIVQESTISMTTATGVSRQVTFNLWDTAGQEKFHSLMPMYYRGAGVAILVFDLTKPPTMKSLRVWVEELKSKSPSTMVFAICGNKADLERARAVTREEGENFAVEIGAIYIEVSAKDSINVWELFRLIGQRVLEHQDAAGASCTMFPSCGVGELLDGNDGDEHRGCCF